MNEKNKPQHVLFEPSYVGWKGLPYAIRDAKQLGVPLAVKTEEIRQNCEVYIHNEGLDCKVVLV